MSTLKNLKTRILNSLKSAKADENGNINGTFRIQESAKGGANFRHAESGVKRLIDAERRTLLAKGTSVTFVALADIFATLTSIDTVLASKVVRTTDRKGKVSLSVVELDEKTRNQRLQALGNRVKAAYCPMFGIDAETLKNAHFSKDDILAILNASGSYFTRNTQAYAAPVKVVKKADVKTAAKSAAKSSKRTSAPQPTV